MRSPPNRQSRPLHYDELDRSKKTGSLDLMARQSGTSSGAVGPQNSGNSRHLFGQPMGECVPQDAVVNLPVPMSDQVAGRLHTPPANLRVICRELLREPGNGFSDLVHDRFSGQTERLVTVVFGLASGHKPRRHRPKPQEISQGPNNRLGVLLGQLSRFGPDLAQSVCPLDRAARLIGRWPRP